MRAVTKKLSGRDSNWHHYGYKSATLNPRPPRNVGETALWLILYVEGSLSMLSGSSEYGTHTDCSLFFASNPFCSQSLK
jgi:hypothetical protein